MYEKNTNQCADKSKARDGGGYYQPLIAGSIGKSLFTIKDTQCGDFGKRAQLNIDDFEAAYDYVSKEHQEWSEIPDRYKAKVSKLNKKFNTFFLVKSQISERKWEE